MDFFYLFNKIRDEKLSSHNVTFHLRNQDGTYKMYEISGAAGAAFDAMDDLPAMIGCVCGDDTVLVVMRDEASAQSFCEELSGLCK